MDYLESWSEGLGDGEWGRLADRYADRPDFVWIEDGRIQYRSVDALRDALTGLGNQFSDERTEFSDPVVVAVGPGRAHVASGFRTTLVRDDGPDVSFEGTLTMLVVHTADGWKALQGHTSTSRDRTR